MTQILENLKKEIEKVQKNLFALEQKGSATKEEIQEIWSQLQDAVTEYLDSVLEPKILVIFGNVQFDDDSAEVHKVIESHMFPKLFAESMASELLKSKQGLDAYVIPSLYNKPITFLEV